MQLSAGIYFLFFTQNLFFLENVHCGFKTGNSQRCSCYKSTLKCTDVCRCSGCANADVDVEDESEEKELEDTDKIDDEF